MADRPLRRANPNTIQEKFMVGYQGWFTCANDGPPLDPGHHGWLHWITEPLDNGGRPNTDLWPDLSAYQESELYTVPGLQMKNGEPARLFSSRNPDTMCRHFYWMAEHGVDGAFLQRFAGQTDLETGNQAMRDQRDQVGRIVRESAEANGRCWAIMYDVSGVENDRIQRVIESDWMHLVNEERVLESSMYLKEKGRPVVVLWGFGFSDRDYKPETVRNVFAFIRNNTPGGAYIMAGVPAHWRSSVSDADPNPDWVDLWLNDVDALSPWTIGRYGDADGADNFAEEKIKGDIEAITKRNEDYTRAGDPRRIDYLPVVFPGGSGTNLSEGKWGYNDIKRDGGKFFWRQVYNARRLGASILYGAMWDEYDEGTAFMPVVAYKSQLPRSDKWPFLSLEEDGYDLPTDWYMRVCCLTGEVLRDERPLTEALPSKELQDYWATHPKREPAEPEVAAAGPSSAAASGKAAALPWEDSKDAKDSKDEPPPPPYSLEADDPRPRPVGAGASSAVPPPVRHDARPDAAQVPSSSNYQSSAPVPPPSSYPAGAFADDSKGDFYQGERPHELGTSSYGQQQGYYPNGPGPGASYGGHPSHAGYSPGYNPGYQPVSFNGPPPPAQPPFAYGQGGPPPVRHEYRPVAFDGPSPPSQPPFDYGPGGPPSVRHDARPPDVNGLANVLARTSLSPPLQQQPYAGSAQPYAGPFGPGPFPQPPPPASAYSPGYDAAQSSSYPGSPMQPRAHSPYAQSPPAQGTYPGSSGPSPGAPMPPQGYGSYTQGPAAQCPYPQGPLPLGAASPPHQAPYAPYGTSSPAQAPYPQNGPPPDPGSYFAGGFPAPSPYGAPTSPGPPPPIPPRHSQAPYYPQGPYTRAPGPGQSPSFAASGPVGGVLNTVERFTSQNTRRQLERGVDDIHRQVTRLFK